MSNSEQFDGPVFGRDPLEPLDETGSAEPAEEIDYEAMAKVVKTGVDRLISATKRSNGKQIAFQVGEVSRNLIALSKACLADVKPGLDT